MLRTSDFLTVATVGYVPQALATLQSAKRHSSHVAFHLFVLDATADTMKQLPRMVGDFASWVNLFGPCDLGPERNAFLPAFKYYNAFEISCFAKYVALSHLLRANSAEISIYADADVLFLGDLNEAVGEIGDKAVLLTPHQLGPTTDSREHLNLIHGWVNGGFFCIRKNQEETRKVLDWLIDRISRRGFYAPQYGLSGDQSWLSSLPFAFHDLTKISRYPGLNVAYWNLEERPLTRTSNGEVHANGVPLLCFHFSGFNPDNLPRLSKHADMMVAAESPLDYLCKLYAEELKTVAALKPKLGSLTTLPCSKRRLPDRVLTGSAQHGITFSDPSAELGLFSRIGRKLDFLKGRIVA